MKKDKLTDEMIARAVSEYVDAWIASLPDPEERDFEASPEYRANMAKLLRKMERREQRQLFTRRTAAVFLLLVLGCSVVVGFIPEVRAGFSNWVRTAYEETVVVRFSGDETQVDMPSCELTWVPSGCELIKKTESYNYISLVYENSYGQGFIFSCDLMTGNSYMQIGVNESVRSEKVYLNKVEAELFFFDDGDTMLLWTDDEGFAYSVMGNVEKSVIMHIAEGVKITN